MTKSINRLTDERAHILHILADMELGNDRLKISLFNAVEKFFNAEIAKLSVPKKKDDETLQTVFTQWSEDGYEIVFNFGTFFWSTGSIGQIPLSQVADVLQDMASSIKAELLATDESEER